MTENIRPERVYHGSHLSPDEFTKAPLIHVGTEQQAKDRKGIRGSVHEFELSKHVDVHPTIFEDEVANTAQDLFLSKRGHKPTLLVTASTLLPRDRIDKIGEIKEAMDALGQNKVIRYHNTGEGETGGDFGTNLSYIVPTPHLNLKQFGGDERWEQQPLPMDYTGTVPESMTTKNSKIR